MMISVVIPAYNAEKTIIECVKSVLNQTSIDLIQEILIINDGSTDKTVEVIEKELHSDKVKIVSKTNGGVSTARNAGIKLAKGEWVALLDSDDIWLPNKIALQVEAINRYPEIAFIGGNRNKENVRLGKKLNGNIYKLNLRNILFKNWPHPSTVLVKKSLFDDVGLFDESMRYAEDGNLWNRVVIKYPIYYVAESVEIAGGLKRAYGEKGLSANIKEMHLGNIHNLKVLREQLILGAVEYRLWVLYFNIKYLKRIIVTKYTRSSEK